MNAASKSFRITVIASTWLVFNLPMMCMAGALAYSVDGRYVIIALVVGLLLGAAVCVVLVCRRSECQLRSMQCDARLQVVTPVTSLVQGNHTQVDTKLRLAKDQLRCQVWLPMESTHCFKTSAVSDPVCCGRDASNPDGDQRALSLPPEHGLAAFEEHGFCNVESSESKNHLIENGSSIDSTPPGGERPCHGNDVFFPIPPSDGPDQLPTQPLVINIPQDSWSAPISLEAAHDVQRSPDSVDVATVTFSSGQPSEHFEADNTRVTVAVDNTEESDYSLHLTAVPQDVSHAASDTSQLDTALSPATSLKRNCTGSDGLSLEDAVEHTPIGKLITFWEAHARMG